MNRKMDRRIKWGALLSMALVAGQFAAARAASPGPQDANAPQNYTTTASGLQYRVLRQGTGDTPAATDTVEVHYEGWLDDGTVFDSSYDRDQKISFQLNGVIPGWTEGLQHVSEGGMIELVIPANLGYGAQKVGPIPANSTLHFLVELYTVQ